MGCRLCAWVNGRLSATCADVLWARSNDWERYNSNEWELWTADSEANRERIDQALAIEDSQPEASFGLLRESADAGSAWAMERVGTHLEAGIGTSADVEGALDYYHRAIGAGAWMATVPYARLLARQDRAEDARAVLEDGVAGDFVPAFFWLAWYRYEQSPSRGMGLEVRPLLEYAAEQGHPGAKLTLARWMVRGRFGIREIPAGFRLLFRLAGEAATLTEPEMPAIAAA